MNNLNQRRSPNGMASTPPSNRDRTNARTAAITGALQLAKQVVVAQLQDIDPIVLDGIKASFARLEEEALGACLPVSAPSASLPPTLPSLPPASLAPASLPPAPASDQPKPIPGPKANPGSEEPIRPAEKGSSTVSQSGETTQPLQEDKAVKQGEKRPGPFIDDSSSEGEWQTSWVNGRFVTSKKRKAEMRLPTKYPAVNEANYVRDEFGPVLEKGNNWRPAFELKRPWMTTAEEEAFFARQSFESRSQDAGVVIGHTGPSIVDPMTSNAACVEDSM
ncbi:MAG: hypothetical protein OHK93_005077 [Ramalina farinacea]|uniref:Uncharacterized protein n=1 Tax=Ramalina farinacea TaxID=258253 RepID=A0AA43TZB3_9LECA|nr:hypothetical protein [Ramalina farinacea]